MLNTIPQLTSGYDRNKTSGIEKEMYTYSFSAAACSRYAARQLCLPGYWAGFSRCFKILISEQRTQLSWL